jgi:hypothetical protein
MTIDVAAIALFDPLVDLLRRSEPMNEAPAAMRKVEHGVTMDGRDTFKMAAQLRKNATTLLPRGIEFRCRQGTPSPASRSSTPRLRRPSSSTARGTSRVYLTASCAAIAAVTLAQINDANAFTKEVLRVEGLGELPATARSGRGRVPSEVPGVVTGLPGRSPASRADLAPREAGPSGRDQAARAGAASRAAEDRRLERPPGRPLPPPALDDDLPPPDDMEFETEPYFEDSTSFTDSFGRPDVPTDPARIEAQRSEAPSAMRKVEHGVTIDGRNTFKMAEKLQKNDTTLRFLAALNFDADEGAEPGAEGRHRRSGRDRARRRRFGPCHAVDRPGTQGRGGEVARAGAGPRDRGQDWKRPGNDGVVPGGSARRRLKT